MTILPVETYSCTFTAAVTGNANIDPYRHGDGHRRRRREEPGYRQDSATVTITDVAPAIRVSKGAAPSEIAEPGGTVNFTVVVTNASHG